MRYEEENWYDYCDIQGGEQMIEQSSAVHNTLTSIGRIDGWCTQIHNECILISKHAVSDDE